MCRKKRSTFISLTAVAVYSQKQKQRLVSKLPDRCFRFDYAWLVTLNLSIELHKGTQLSRHIQHHGIQHSDGGHAFHDDDSSGDDDGIVTTADGKIGIFTGAVHGLLGAEDGGSGFHISTDDDRTSVTHTS